MSKPLLRIGVPIYNEAKYIAATLQSALDQTFTDFELVIYDNCSDDGTYEIAQEFQKKDTRVKIVRHKENLGAIKNFELANKESETKYVMWLAGHDILQPDYIRRAVEWLEANEDYAMAYPKVYAINDKSEIIQEGQEGYIVDDQVDTSNLSTFHGLVKVFNGLGNCWSTHGVYRAHLHKNLTFEKVVSFDVILIFRIAEKGKFKLLDYKGIQTRHVRASENEATFFARLIRMGVMSESDVQRNAYSKLAYSMIRHTFGMNKLNFIEKIKLSYVIIKRFQSARKVTVSQIFYWLGKYKV